MSHTSILSVIQYYQRSIEKYQTDEARLLHCVGKLYKLPVKVEHLQETGIGKTVNALRKYEGEIGAAAKALVAKWKAMVAAEEEPMETDCNEHETNYSNDNDDETDDENHHGQNKNSNKVERNERSPKSSKEHGHSDGHNGNKEKGHQTISSSSSHHKPSNSSSNTHDSSSSSKHKSKSSHSESNSSASAEKKKSHSDSHHKSHMKDDARKEGTTEKIKEKEVVHRSNDEKHKSSSSSSSRHKDESNSHKKEHSNSNGEHHSKKSKSSSDSHKESSHKQHNSHSSHSSHSSKEHKDRDKSVSSKEKEQKLKKDVEPSKDKHKSTSKEREHNHEKKTHKSSSKSTSSSSSAHKTKDSTSTPAQSSSSEANSERKRHRHNSEQESSGESVAHKPKIAKQKKAAASAEANDNDEADFIDSSMGANFADVLGMLNMPAKKSKKLSSALKSPIATSVKASPSTTNSKSVSSSSKDTQHKSKSGSSSSSKLNGITASSSTNGASTSKKSELSKPDLLSSSAKLEPLDPSIALELPTISNNYKPMPLNQTVMDVVFASSSHSSAPKAPVRTLTDAEALKHGISSKTMRTKIYSGVRTGQLLQVPTLFDLCIRVLQKNIDALEYTGGVPFEVLRPVLDRATPQQLLIFEEYNPYLMEDSDVLWQQHVQRHYRAQKRKEMESWREMFLRCQEDQERKLNILAESIKQSQKIITAPVRKTQLAFVDSMVKPPRNVLRKQEQYGTKSKLVATPASRVASLSNATPNVAKTGDTRLRVAPSVRDHAQVSSVSRPKKAPLMAKTLQFIRGRQKR